MEEGNFRCGCTFALACGSVEPTHCAKSRAMDGAPGNGYYVPALPRHPGSAWVTQQLRDAFPYDSAPEYLIFDRATNFNEDVIRTMKSIGIAPRRTAYRSPWQNGVAERWVGNCRRDLLDHVVVVNQHHLKRLMSEYVRYYHEDRTHLALEKGTPAGRMAAENTSKDCRVLSMPRIGGLHHRYDLAA